MLGFSPNEGIGGFYRSDDGGKELVGDARVVDFPFAFVPAGDDGFCGGERAAGEVGGFVEVHVVLRIPEEAGVIGSFLFVERCGGAEGKAVAGKIEISLASEFESDRQLEEIWSAGNVRVLEREGFLDDDPAGQLGDEDRGFTRGGLIDLVGVSGVLGFLLVIDEPRDRAGAVAVDPNLGFLADVLLVLELSKFDAAADVGEGEGDLVVFEDDEFLLGRRGRSLDAQTCGGLGDLGGSFQLSLFRGRCRGLGGRPVL